MIVDVNGCFHPQDLFPLVLELTISTSSTSDTDHPKDITQETSAPGRQDFWNGQGSSSCSTGFLGTRLAAQHINFTCQNHESIETG